MNPVRQAIVTKLAGDSTLVGMLSSSGAIYHRQAPATAHTPYIVVDKSAGTRQPMFHGAYITRDAWMIKAVDFGRSATVAEDIDARVDVLLNGAALPLTGGATAHVVRTNDVDYGEADGDQLYQHVGGIYRVMDP